MNDELFSLLKRPALWQRSAAPFWDDDHISKGMLSAHLDTDCDAASRRFDTIDRSVGWLSGVIPAGCRLLDLGCGPGLYAKRLSDLGYSVVGMDISRRSIAYAREHDKKTEYICQSYLELDRVCEFDAATLIYCDYAALTQPERAELLNRVRRALKPGGMLILDVFSDAHMRGISEATSWSVCEHGGFWSEQPHVCLEAVHLYEGDSVCAEQYVVVTDASATEYIVWNTGYTKAALCAELVSAGFSVADVCGDVCGSPYTDASDTICVIAKSIPTGG